MTEKWLIAPGQERVIDIERASKLKIGLVGGQVDVRADLHDRPYISFDHIAHRVGQRVGGHGHAMLGDQRLAARTGQNCLTLPNKRLSRAISGLACQRPVRRDLAHSEPPTIAMYKGLYLDRCMDSLPSSFSRLVVCAG